jgi:hypothetical protein
MHAEKYDLAICAIFRDEAPYLKEWLDFHIKQGAQHFYLFDNASADDCDDVLAPYIHKQMVTLYRWPFHYLDESGFSRIQSTAYMACLNAHGRECTWIAFLDLDEFLFSPLKVDLKEIVSCYKSHAAICVNWVMYGTSNVEKAKSILKELVYRCPLESEFNLHVKSIVQPKYVTGNINPHFFYYEGSKFAVNEKEEPVVSFKSDSFSAGILRINHYWSRDLSYFHDVKIRRRTYWGRSTEETFAIESMLNEVYDPILAD